MTDEVRCKVCRRPAPRGFSMANDHVPPATLDLRVCPGCGLTFVVNVPSPERLRAVYDEMDDLSLDAPETETKCRTAWRDLRPLLADSGALLDVGTGNGALLRVARAEAPGMKAVGYEPHRASAKAARAAGLEVYEDEAAPALQGPFTAITLLDVAEHVPDPMALFTQLATRLRPGGYLYVHTPRRCVWDSLALWATLAGLPPQRLLLGWLRTRVSLFHLHLWSDQALRGALETTGFEVRSFVKTCELSWPAERYARVYVGDKLGMPLWVVRGVAVVFRLVTQAGLLRNKAIVLAQRR